MNYYEFYKINSEEGLPFLELSAELWKENNTNNNRWIMALLCPPNVLHLQECWNDLFARRVTEVFFCQHQTCHYSPEWILRLTTHLLPITDKCDLDLQTKIFFLNVRERFHEIIQRKWKAEKKTQL